MDISDQELLMNSRLRPGTDLLGAKSVNREIAMLGVEDHIIRLPHGFNTLIGLIDEGAIKLSPCEYLKDHGTDDETVHSANSLAV